MPNAKTICTVCNYIYDEVLGEPGQDITAALKFDDLPDTWICPECDAAKDMFQPCSCISLSSIDEQSCLAHTSNTDSLSAVAEELSKTSVGELVAQRPARACVLEQYSIDYCCSGKVSLEDACQKKGLDVKTVLRNILDVDHQERQSSEPDWTTASLKDLIDHIIIVYHQPLRQELVRMAQLAEKVARVHGANHPEMIEVKNVFDGFKTQLELHMQKEEMVLFPGIASMEATGSPQIFGCGGGVEHPIEVLSQEHDGAGEALAKMRQLTNDYTAPVDACNTFKVLLHSLAKIETAMHQHVHKENSILFPRALKLRNSVAVAR